MEINGNSVDTTALYNVAQAIIDLYKKELTTIDARGTGSLINSVDYDIVEKDGAITLQMTVNDYYYFIEWGRGPSVSNGWDTPIEDLSKWIESKRSRGKLVDRVNKPVPTTQKEVRSVAYAIYNKITEQGYYGSASIGKHPLKYALEDAKNDGLVEAFANAFTGAYKDAIVTSLKDLENRTSAKRTK